MALRNSQDFEPFLSKHEVESINPIFPDHPIRILAIRSALPMAMLAKAAPTVAVSELIPGSPVGGEHQQLPQNGPSR